jgi:hypothetical protein
MRAWLTPPPPAAERALEQLNYTKINDKPIRLMWSHRDPNTRKNNAANIFIKARPPRACAFRRPRAPRRPPPRHNLRARRAAALLTRCRRACARAPAASGLHCARRARTR